MSIICSLCSLFFPHTNFFLRVSRKSNKKIPPQSTVFDFINVASKLCVLWNMNIKYSFYSAVEVWETSSSSNILSMSMMAVIYNTKTGGSRRMNGKGKGRALVGNNKIAFDVAGKKSSTKWFHTLQSSLVLAPRLSPTNKPENYGQTEKKIIDSCYVAHRTSFEKKN